MQKLEIQQFFCNLIKKIISLHYEKEREHKKESEIQKRLFTHWISKVK